MDFDNNMNTDDLNTYEYLNSASGRVNLYGVPEDYFDTFCDKILSEIRLGALRGKETFLTDANYFSEFPERILSKIKAAEYEEATPLLDSISKENVYSVPADYFGKFSAKAIKYKEEEESIETKIISFVPKRRTWRPAIAAAVISLIVLGAGFVWENNKTVPKVKTPYASVIQQDLSSLSNQEISDYLSSPEATSDEDNIEEKTDLQTKNELNNISGNEVETYLNRTPATY